MKKYDDEMLIDIEIRLYFNIHHKQPDKVEKTKIRNRIVYNGDTKKEDSLHSINSDFYKKHSRWPTSCEYSTLLENLYNKIMAQKAP